MFFVVVGFFFVFIASFKRYYLRFQEKIDQSYCMERYACVCVFVRRREVVGRHNTVAYRRFVDILFKGMFSLYHYYLRSFLILCSACGAASHYFLLIHEL